VFCAESTKRSTAQPGVPKLKYISIWEQYQSPSLWRAFLPILSARAERIGPRRDGQAAESRRQPGQPPPRQGRGYAERSRPFPTVRRIGVSGISRNGQDRSLRRVESAGRKKGDGAKPRPRIFPSRVKISAAWRRSASSGRPWRARGRGPDPGPGPRSCARRIPRRPRGSAPRGGTARSA
jgi:hypothetical protein